MLTEGDIPFLHCIGERPTDVIAWKHYSAWLANKGEIETSVFVNVNWDMIRIMVCRDWPSICEIRHLARETGEYALEIVTYLLPLIRWQSRCFELEDLTTGSVDGWDEQQSWGPDNPPGRTGHGKGT